MGGGAIDGGVVGGPGVGIEGPIGGEEVGPIGAWIFGDVLRFDTKSVKWEPVGIDAESVAWI